MVTIRQLAACLGQGGSVVLVRSLFGGQTPPLSALALISAAMQRQVDLNVIRVGAELFTGADELEILAALQMVGIVYSQVDLGLGTTQHFCIPLQASTLR